MKIFLYMAKYKTLFNYLCSNNGFPNLHLSHCSLYRKEGSATTKLDSARNGSQA